MTKTVRDRRERGQVQLKKAAKPAARHVEPDAILALVPTAQRLEVAAMLLADEVRRLRDPSIAPPAGATDSRVVALSCVLRDSHALRQHYGGASNAGNLDGISVRYRLSPRQKDVLALLLYGLSEKSIAGQMKLSRHTVHEHVKHIYRVMLVNSRSELMVKCLREEFHGLANVSRDLARGHLGSSVATG